MSDIHIACQYFLNHTIREQELRRQISMLARAGYECICLRPGGGLETPYLSDAWWKAADTVIDECCTHNIKFGISTENMLSDSVRTLPPLHLECEIFTAAAKEQFHAVLSNSDPVIGCYAVYDNGKIKNISSRCGIVSQFCRGTYFPRRAIDFTPEYQCKILAVKAVKEDDLRFIDTMNPHAVNHLIERTCQEYYKRYSTLFGTIITTNLINEPVVHARYPWTEGFEQRYQEMWDSSVTDLLPHLFFEINETTYLVREQYYLTVKDLVCRNFFAEIQTWCREHKIDCAGTISANTVNTLRCFRHLDIPCTDIDAPNSLSLLKTVSSAAKLFRKRLAVSNSLSDDKINVSLRDLRCSADFQMALGINAFNVQELFYSVDGHRKHQIYSGLFYQHTQWEIMPCFLQHLKEICKKLSNSPSSCRTAMLYPVSQFCCKDAPQIKEKLNGLVNTLLSNGGDFDFIDELTLIELTAETISEKYDFFIVPEITLINRSAAEVLENYTGKLICCGKTAPQYTCGGSWSYYQANYISSPLAHIRREDIRGDGAQYILFRKCEDGTVFLFNRSEQPFTGTFNGIDISLAPRCGELLEKAAVFPPKVKTTLQLTGSWKIEISENHVGLSDAFVKFSDTSSACLKAGTPILAADKKITECVFEFLSTGSIKELFLVTDKEIFDAPFICKVNGCEVKDFYLQQKYDCCNMVCDISRFVKNTQYPAKNTLSFTFPENGTSCFEMPYLYGKFSVELKYIPHEIPHIRENSLIFNAPCGDARPLGLETYSGKISYSKNFEWRGGYLIIDANKVESACSIKIDGTEIGTVYNMPYKLEAGFVPPGKHLLEITVFNTPENRSFMHGIPSGLFGPVNLLECEV